MLVYRAVCFFFFFFTLIMNWWSRSGFCRISTFSPFTVQALFAYVYLYMADLLAACCRLEKEGIFLRLWRLWTVRTQLSKQRNGATTLTTVWQSRAYACYDHRGWLNLLHCGHRQWAGILLGTSEDVRWSNHVPNTDWRLVRLDNPLCRLLVSWFWLAHTGCEVC